MPLTGARTGTEKDLFPHNINIMSDQEFTYPNIGDGIQLVAAAGTPEALASATPIRLVVVQALPENTGNVAVGSSTVVAAAGTRRGYALAPGQSVALRVTDLSKVYVDAVTSGEGVSFTYFW